MKDLFPQKRITLVLILVCASTLILAGYILRDQAHFSVMVAWCLFFVLCGTLSWVVLGPNTKQIYREVSGLRNLLQRPDGSNGDFQVMDLPVAVLEIDDDESVKFSNQAAKSLLSIENAETPQLSELLEGLGQPVRHWVADLKGSKNKRQSEFALAKRSDDELYLQIQLMQSDGHTLAVVTDATELKTLEAQFVQSQKMQAIGQLAGGIAHDFNNLLTAISGYCDLLLLRHEKGDPDHSDLVQISNNANRAAFLVSHLLAYSRKQMLKPATVQINDTLADMTHLLNRLVGEKISVHLDQAKHLPMVYADSRQLEQVVMNLVVNARDAMPEGGEIGIKSHLSRIEDGTHIEGVSVKPGDYVTIEVTDGGTGMQNSVRERIFEPFFTTKDVGKGTGLGLSMAYGIMKQMGGYIFVESKVGKGTTFRLHLKAGVHVEEPKSIEAKPAIHRSGNLTGIRVLLVEDEDPVLAVSKRALQSQGLILETAQSGREALKVIESGVSDFDVVVTDVVMPDIDGPTWVEQARENGFNAQVIFVSGYAKETLTDKWGKIDDAMFLPKPYSLKQLIDTVDMASNHQKVA